MATIQIKIPDWLDRICAWPVLVYRRRKYGYSYRRIYLGEGDDNWNEKCNFVSSNNTIDFPDVGVFVNHWLECSDSECD